MMILLDPFQGICFLRNDNWAFPDYPGKAQTLEDMKKKTVTVLAIEYSKKISSETRNELDSLGRAL